MTSTQQYNQHYNNQSLQIYYPSKLINICHLFNIESKFRLKKYQQEIFHTIDNYDRVVIIASRQIGKSEAILRYALTYAQIVPDQIILIISAAERQANEILNRIQIALTRQDEPIEFIKNSATEIKLSNNSRIVSLPNSPKTVRGFPANLLLIDEVDSVADDLDQWDDFVAGLFPSVSRVGGTIVCSGTYIGKKQLYNLTQDPEWQLCGPYAWTVNPPPDIEQQRHDLTADRFEQEFNCVPIDRSSTLFPYQLFDDCIDDNLVYGTIKRDEDANYFGGYDPAKLVDNSMLTILEELNDRVRLIELKNIGGQKYSEQASTIEDYHFTYHFHKLNIDCTGVGNAAYELVENKIGSYANGITFTRSIKEKIINDLRIAFQDRLIIVPDDKYLRKELHDLDPKTLDHPSNGSSDRVWSLALAWQAYLNRNAIDLSCHIRRVIN